MEYVVAELKVLQRRGIKKVAFGDGTFNFSTKRLQAFLKAFRKNDFDFELYDIDCRADLFDEEQAEILEALGVVDVGFGLETVNRHTQRLIRKNLDPDAVARSVNVAKSHGFNVHVSMMVGLPGETREDVIRTVEFLQKVRADYVGVFPVRLQQGTEMARMPEHRIAHRMTKEDITELVEMVRERFSTVVPRHEYYTLRRRLGAFLFN